MSSRRFVSHPIALASVLLASAAPMGCQQVQELINGKAEDKPVETPVTPPVAPVAPPVVAPTAMPVPVPEQHAVTLDSMLALVHAGSTSEFAVVRNPATLLDLGDEAFKFYDGPVQAMVAMLGAQEVASGFAAAKAGLVNARTQLASSGIDLTRGLVVTQTGTGSASAVFLVSADKPEGVKGLLTALKLPGAEKTVCQSIAAAPGYVGCADTEAVLKEYKPGDGKLRRDAATAALPGVNLDELSVLFYSPENGGMHMGASTPAGAGVVHIGMAAGANDMKDVLAGLEPGPSTMLRFVQPGAGFVWARTDVANLKQKSPEIAAVPPPFDAVVNGWSGELLFAGSSDPAALELRLGIGDTKAVASMIKAGVDAVKKMVPPSVPGLDKSKLKLEMVDVKFGTETVQAAHLGVTGVEQAPTLKHLVGLGLDAWVFAAEGSLAIALGPDEASVGKLVAETSVEATLASLPQALAEDLRANRVDFVLHTPLDALQGPSLRKGLDAVLKNVAQYKPEQARSALAMLAPVSSGTVWMTESGGVGVIHLAVQGVGNTADEEGKAALAAAVAVAGGGDPAVLFGELVTKYPGSPRLAAYQARAGSNGPGVLIGSAVGGLALSGAMAFTILNNMINPNLATELGVPPPVVEKPAEKKPVETKTGETKTGETKTGETKTGETKTGETKTGETKTGETKTGETKTGETKTGETKTGETKGGEIKVGDVKPIRKGREPVTPK